jgi:hypothetical protein
LDLALSLDDGVAAHLRRLGHRALATTAEHLCGGAGHHPALDLVHVGKDHLEESRETLVGDLHPVWTLRAV